MGHIELIGLPAAGKTTLLENLQGSDLTRGRVIHAPLKRAPVTIVERLARRGRDISSVSRQLFGNPSRARAIWRACGAFGQPSMTQQLRMYLNCLRVDSLARSNRGRAGKNNTVILDQGIFQSVWSLALRADFESRERYLQCARNLLGCLATPTLVILVDVPSELSLQRLMRDPKPHGRLPVLLVSDPAWMDRAQEVLEDIWDIACDDPVIRTFRYVPDDDSLQEVVHAIWPA